MTPPRRDHQMERLFEDYLDKAGTRHRALEATALRTESRGMRELLAYGASRGTLSLKQLTAAIMAGDNVPTDPQHLASLARVRALQNFDADDRPFALAALPRANAELPHDKAALPYRILEVQLLLEDGEYERIADLLQSTNGLRRHPELIADLTNPFTESPYADATVWLQQFNERLIRFGHEPVIVLDGPGEPFDRLHAEAPSVASPELISVIMTTYRPDRHAVLASAKSILNQTWQNLELLVVDDASPSEFDHVLNELATLDERVTLHRLPRNQGTYGARNFGLSKAHGVYITGQDDDDWSHPRRLEVQVRALRSTDDTPATRLASLPARANLIRTRTGYGYVGENSSSLMFRQQWLAHMGGYLPVRKAADNEFSHRLQAVSGQQVKVLPDPLTIIRVSPGSLSRDDYRPGWSHPARRSFRSAYTAWHAETSDLRVDPQAPPPLAVPRRFDVAPRPREELDVVFAGDWRQYGGPQRSMLEEIAALRQRGMRVGVLHLEAARFMSQATKPLCRPVQRLINRGDVVEVFIDDDAAVRLLILRYPPILQFQTNYKTRLDVSRLIILANQAPSERDGTDVRYRTEDCTRNGRELFGAEPLWVPQGPVIRDILKHLIPQGNLAHFDMPGILNIDNWMTLRKGFRSNIPVVGRHSRDNVMKWPGDRNTLRSVYPTDGSVDVRIMGGGKTPRRLLGVRHNPAAWLVLETDEIPVRTFLNSIDYFVYYQHEHAYDAFGRATLEAIAAGCVAILPHFLEPTFGKAAMYASTDEAIPLVQELYSKPQAHWQQVSEANRVLRERFSYSAYADRVSDLLNQTAIASE